ncbi:hypothetical protein ACEQ8H_008549 [Pleosporales sp. CAS-2024a]
MSRHQGVLASVADRSALLQAGIVQKAFRQLAQQYPQDALTPSIDAYTGSSVDSVIATIANASLDTKLPLDRLSSGNGLIYAYLASNRQNKTYEAAIDALQQSVDLQPRNQDGSLWFYVYPNYTYLDGMISLAPFLTLYSTSLAAGEGACPSGPSSFNETITQLDLLWQNTRLESGLLVHGYDASKRAVWANATTGASPHAWGRALGWYCMALVDVLELLPLSAVAARQWVEAHFKALMGSVVDAVDESTGAWWQVLDQPGRAKNYIESSSSAMFVYSLLKGRRMGYLGGQEVRVEAVAKRAYEYLVDTFVVHNANGTLGWNGTVSVCSLNSTASYEYYVGQPILYNSVLGSAAFVRASLEYERLRGAGGG